MTEEDKTTSISMDVPLGALIDSLTDNLNHDEIFWFIKELEKRCEDQELLEDLYAHFKSEYEDSLDEQDMETKADAEAAAGQAETDARARAEDDARRAAYEEEQHRYEEEGPHD